MCLRTLQRKLPVKQVVRCQKSHPQGWLFYHNSIMEVGQYRCEKKSKNSGRLSIPSWIEHCHRADWTAIPARWNMAHQLGTWENAGMQFQWDCKYLQRRLIEWRPTAVRFSGPTVWDSISLSRSETAARLQPLRKSILSYGRCLYIPTSWPHG